MKHFFIIILTLISVTAFSQTYVQGLKASGNDPDGNIVSYKWSQTSGPVCTFKVETVDSITVTFITSGHYVFQCVAVDNSGAPTTSISTGDIYPANIPPTLKIVPETFTGKLK